MERPVNERQLDVLRWVAEDCPAGKWPEGDYSYKTSAKALQDRGLVNITGHAQSWAASITKTGTYYLEHGAYPLAPFTDSERSAYKDGVSALQNGKALVKQLQDEGMITISDPDEQTRARYRQTLHACRAHHLAPDGQELRFTGRDSGDIIIQLGTPSLEEETDWNRIRLNARKVTTNLDALRSALETSSILDQLSEALRPRAIAFLIDLAEHLRASDLPLGANTKLKTPKLFIKIGTRRRDVYLTEILDEVPHKVTPQEERELRRAPWKQAPKHDRIPSGRLLLRVIRDGSHKVSIGYSSYSYQPNTDEFSDQKRKPLERQVREIARAIKKGVNEDIDAREREEQQRAQAQEAYARQKAEERQTWESIRGQARGKALLEIREATFARAFQDWKQAEELRTFAARLEADAAEQQMLEARPRLQQWLQWARERADEIDPIKNLAKLDDDVFDAEPSADELRPHMEGWDPNAPHKDYSANYRVPDREPTTPPAPRPWHPGMAGRPNWWR